MVVLPLLCSSPSPQTLLFSPSRPCVHMPHEQLKWFICAIVQVFQKIVCFFVVFLKILTAGVSETGGGQQVPIVPCSSMSSSPSSTRSAHAMKCCTEPQPPLLATLAGRWFFPWFDGVVYLVHRYTDCEVSRVFLITTFSMCSLFPPTLFK